MNNAAVASSTTRRSALNLAVMVVSILGLPFSPVSILTCPGTTFLSPPPTAKMAPWGGLITALNSEIPNIPRLLIVNVPPWNSSGANLLSLARVAKSLTFAEISVSDNPCVDGTIGVMSPVGVATATLISTFSKVRCDWDLESKVALTSGTSRKASALALIMKSLTDTLVSNSFARTLRRLRMLSSGISMDV